jgi:hypothetical protein
MLATVQPQLMATYWKIEDFAAAAVGSPCHFHAA